MKRYWHLWFNALFLKAETFEQMSAERYAFAHGLTLIALIGALVGVSRLIGATLRYLGSPPLDQIKNTVLVHLERMPWYLQLADRNGAAFIQQFSNSYNQWWQIFGDLLVPNPLSPATLASIILVPLGLVFVWLVYGAFVHLFARMLGGQGNLGHGLGTLALAVAPQALNIFTLIPGFELGGGLVSLWTLIANYVAVRANYHLSPIRTIWAMLIPILLFILLLLILGLIGVAVLARAGGRQ